jgi:chromosome segregation ATPase
MTISLETILTIVGLLLSLTGVWVRLNSQISVLSSEVQTLKEKLSDVSDTIKKHDSSLDNLDRLVTGISAKIEHITAVQDSHSILLKEVRDKLNEISLALVKLQTKTRTVNNA